MTDMELANAISEKVSDAGGDAYFVGGFVRDELLGRENKDIDIEIHRIQRDKLREILKSFGELNEIGKSFGVFRVKGFDLDISMPRKEHQTGAKHTDFDIEVDPFIGEKEAARRRDFTINALMMAIPKGAYVVDPFGGFDDLENGIIRHVDDKTFREDALRVLRAAQFAARLNFTVADDTVKLCRRMPLADLPKERVFGEMEKALLKAERPSVFFETLRSMDKLGEWFPELNACIGVPQSVKYHQEGDVWRHTMLVIDEAAKLRGNAENPLALMLAAVCHDFGKPACTVAVEGGYKAHGHEDEMEAATRFMNRLVGDKELKSEVLNLCRMHMKPHRAAQNHSHVKKTNRMFYEAKRPRDLILLSVSDSLGKIPQITTEAEFLEERYKTFKATMEQPYVTGRDLVAAGLKANRNFTDILNFATKLRLAQIPKDDALKQTLAYARTEHGMTVPESDECENVPKDESKDFEME